MHGGDVDSPVSNDGRGLKLAHSCTSNLKSTDSPVSNDGRGLKPDDAKVVAKALGGFARQQ